MKLTYWTLCMFLTSSKNITQPASFNIHTLRKLLFLSLYSIWMKRKNNHREVKQIAKSPTASRRWSWIQNQIICLQSPPAWPSATPCNKSLLLLIVLTYPTSLVKVKMLVTQLCPTASHQAPLTMGFSRQGYWCSLPFPSPGDFTKPGIKLRSPALQADSLPIEWPGKTNLLRVSIK